MPKALTIETHIATRGRGLGILEGALLPPLNPPVFSYTLPPSPLCRINNVLAEKQTTNVA